MDHLAGFLWLLRRRVGLAEACRVFGPPGVARSVAAMAAGFTWDRIGDDGPQFEILELDGDTLRRWRLQVGRHDLQHVDDTPVSSGAVLAEPGLTVRAVTLDHGTPVLAYALEEGPQLAIRSQGLAELGLASGAWAGELKRCAAEDRDEALVTLPDGRQASVAELAPVLLETRPGQRLVYATDVADTPANREALIDLARGAHVFVCEAAFLEEHNERARETGHLTARACGEIAAAADVGWVVPFHLSARYQERPARVLAEVARYCDRVWTPRGLTLPE
jgi:ribonuclease BN (tRNA processing enzyme)